LAARYRAEAWRARAETFQNVMLGLLWAAVAALLWAAFVAVRALDL